METPFKQSFMCGCRRKEEKLSKCFLYSRLFIEIAIATKDPECSKDSRGTKRTMCRFDKDMKTQFPLCKVLLR